MTLHKQLLLFILVLFLVMLVGTLALDVRNTQQFLEEQLASHAQDTATSLGLSLSEPMKSDDRARLVSMVDAIFDRGYYRSIVITDARGETLLERHLKTRVDAVPGWLVDLVPLRTPARDALVMAGWRKAATVRVASHPGYAYDVLWRTVQRMLLWFAALAAATLVLGLAALRMILRPVRAVQRQAEAVSEQRYEVQERLPRTPELRSVVAAMNQMTVKVKEAFAEQAEKADYLRRLAFLDPLTRLPNRRQFDAVLGQRLEAQPPFPAALLLVSLDRLADLNDERGHEAGDALVTAAAKALQEAVGDRPEAFLGRLSGSDFVVLARAGEKGEVEGLAATISDRLARLAEKGLGHGNGIGHIGAALGRPGDTPAELLERADAALREALRKGENTFETFEPPAAEVHEMGRGDWKARIEEALDGGAIALHQQPVKAIGDDGTILHREVLARIAEGESQWWDACRFLPLAEQLDLTARLDQQIIDRVLAAVEGLGSETVAINLSPASLQSASFLQWLDARLAAWSPARGGRHLVFELSEFGVVHELAELKAFASRVRGLGHGVAIDHFGRSFADFGYLQSVRPEYVKLDAGYVERIATDSDDQFYVGSLRSVAHTLDIAVIASAVETREQWQALRTLKVDGVQGYAAGRPEPVETV